MREVAFLLALCVSAACIVVGVATWSPGLAWIVAGVLLTAIAFLGLREVGTAVPESDATVTA